MARILISAAHKSSGKTTVSIGLCAALKNRGLSVQAFKKGPDYIDPMWLAKASGHPCHNLDFYTMERDEILATYHRYAQDRQFSLIEGNKGLYDGLDLHGSNSNAALASLLNAPVILVIDAQGMTRGIAPLILGYQAFDTNINIAGVILNKLGGSRHESKLRAVIEHYTDVPVIGAVHKDEKLKLLERHLGLIPSNELNDAQQHIATVADLIAAQVDLNKLLDTAASGSPTLATPIPEAVPPPRAIDVRIGVAQDAAFGFYYPGDLDAFQQAGAQLIPINTLTDPKLPEIDGLFIGGGFPETHVEQLQANQNLRDAIRSAIDDGMPVYAECGGLMYLSRNIHWNNKSYTMVGALPADTVMHRKPQGRGYVQMQETAEHPWEQPDQQSHKFAGHEFHYSSLENLDANFRYAYKVLRGTGINGEQDGIIYKNTLACYVHSRDVKNNRWVERFVNFVRQCQQSNAAEKKKLESISKLASAGETRQK